ncbi:hypothetical protein LY78DRAFT_660372 [Colletotrichum sublineola]|nr:hypothetical protein LY78DRAFT_660372 [Colletotrichum sublineola]
MATIRSNLPALSAVGMTMQAKSCFSSQAHAILLDPPPRRLYPSVDRPLMARYHPGQPTPLYRFRYGFGEEVGVCWRYILSKRR